MNDLIHTSRTLLNFYGSIEHKSIVFTWTPFEVDGIRVMDITGLIDFSADYYITEDTYLGKCVMTFHNSVLESGTKQNVVRVVFGNSKGYLQEVVLELRQTGRSMDPDYIVLKSNVLIAGFTLDTVKIPYGIFGGEQVTGLEYDSSYGVSASREGTDINIMTAWNEMVKPTELYKKSVVTVKTKDSKSRVSRYPIDVYVIMPKPVAIWRDTVLRYDSQTDYADCAIYLIPNGIDVEETPVYEGRIYRKPDSDSIEFNLNDICADFLEQHIDMTKEGISKSFDYGKNFILKVDGRWFGTYTFFNDYSYQPVGMVWKVNNYVGNPIRDVIVRGQYFTGSMFIADLQPQGEFPLITECATVDGQYFPVPEFSKTYLDGMQRTDIVMDTHRLLPDSKYMKCGRKIFRVIENCGIKYVLHYCDKQGGYCSIPVEANVNLLSKSRPYAIERRYSNLKADFGTKNYLQHITPEYEVTLPLLRLEEAMRIDEITQSNQIWLERLSDNSMTPLILTDTKTDFKNNQKVRNYTLHFKASQRKMRR